MSELHQRGSHMNWDTPASAVNQMHRSPPLQGGVEATDPSLRVMRVFTDSEGVPGR